MIHVTGQSLAAASDAVTRNGKNNTTFALGLLVTAGLIGLVAKHGIRYYLKKKENKRCFARSVSLENTKHNHRVEEAKLKNDLKKEIIDYRREQHTTETSFNPNNAMDTKDENAYVETYDEIISGEEVLYTDLRLALSCFHLGEDCGLIGRTNIGKTTFIMHLATAIARGFQKDGAIISPEWSLKQPMKVLYFAFEQRKKHFKVKYGRFIKHIPNLHIDVKTSAGDFRAIQKKIMKMQNEIGNYRLLVIFDNITKMKSRKSNDKKAFFQWLEDYRIKCDNEGKSITYLKIFHTTGCYKDYMPMEATTNYGDKTDTYFTQDLVAFGFCKGGNGKLRYIKELKNKLEADGEKQLLSVYKFADTDAPMYDYMGEFAECDILPSKSALKRGSKKLYHNLESSTPLCKRGRNEDYSHDLLVEMDKDHKAGLTWSQIMEAHGIECDYSNKEEVKNKSKGIRKAMKRHGIRS